MSSITDHNNIKMLERINKDSKHVFNKKNIDKF
jgi:hypothetical protein